MRKGDRVLALHGGSPVREEVLPYGRQVVDESDIAAVERVLRSNWLTTGPAVAAFESALAERVGARFAVAVSSGTAALHAACFAAGLSSGDEAVTTPFTFCATANSVLYTGARPVFADVSEDTLNLDPERVSEQLTDRTRAILAVDYAGHPADLEALGAIARDRSLVLIDDASHALGACQDGRPLGSVAALTCFSFHPVKHVAAGEGGAVTTDDPELAARLKRFRTHGIASDPHTREKAGDWFYEMTDLGMNYRVSDLACALALSQLGRLTENLERRRSISSRYERELGELEAVRLPSVRSGADPAWHIYPIRLVPGRLSGDRREIFQALRAEGLGVNVHYIPVHLHPYYREHLGTRSGMFPVSEAAYEQLITLPIFHGMTEKDAGDVVAAVRKVVSHYRRN